MSGLLLLLVALLGPLAWGWLSDILVRRFWWGSQDPAAGQPAHPAETDAIDFQI